MHVIFIPYGKRSEVEVLLRDMDAQKHQLPMTKGKKKMYLWIQGQVRHLPFGVYEYICPRGDMDAVLTTLNPLESDKDKYQLGSLKLAFIRKMIKCKKIKDFNKEKKYLWVKEDVCVILLGIREDYMEYVDPDGPYKGWMHEAI